MRITFLEIGASPRPVGSTKIVYEHANRLAARGHAVRVVHPVYPEPRSGLFGRLKQAGRYRRWGLSQAWSPGAWMDIDPRVEVAWTPDLSSRHLPEGDLVIATHWRTVAPMTALSPAHGKPVFFAQHWDFGEHAELEPGVRQAWRIGCFKIVINHRAAQLAQTFGSRPWLAPNGLDATAWVVDTPPVERASSLVATLWHPAQAKGFRDALEACALARRTRPDLRLVTFGAAPLSMRLPSWVEHHGAPGQAELRALLNAAAVFVGAGRNEGWGLAPCEAGLCGAALAVTDNMGHAEFARHGDTALVSPVRDPAAMAANILALVENPDLRVRLANAARAQLETFTWERSSRAFEAGLRACLDGDALAEMSGNGRIRRLGR